jgi:membrane protease subunit HflK
VEREYSKAPQVTKTRLYLETMAAVLPKSEKRVLIDSSLKGLLPILSVGDKKQ